MFINVDYPQFCLYFVRVIKKKESQKKFIIFDFLQSLQDKTPIILLLTFFYLYFGVSFCHQKNTHMLMFVRKHLSVKTHVI